MYCYQVHPNEVKRIGRWQPPPKNFYKLNTDGALFFDINEAGIGAFLIDNGGNPVMVVSKNERGNLQSKTVKCLAILSGLQFCLH